MAIRTSVSGGAATRPASILESSAALMPEARERGLRHAGVLSQLADLEADGSAQLERVAVHLPVEACPRWRRHASNETKCRLSATYSALHREFIGPAASEAADRCITRKADP
jgi:hypothetical protein